MARIGLLALALAHWKYAGSIVLAGLLPVHPMAIGMVVVLFLTSFALCVVAMSSCDRHREARWVWLSLVTLLAGYAYLDAMAKAGGQGTSDGHIFMDVAARLFTSGINPYAHSLADGYRVFRLPLSYATPLADGSFTDRLAYPSLSFLVLVPFVLLHVPTYLAYALAFAATMALLVWKAPWWGRGIVLVALTLDDTLLRFAFGGVTDSLWALCVVGAVMAWSRPSLAAVLVGLACAQKQHPWFLVPYLLARVAFESGQSPWALWRPAPRRFSTIVGGVFAVLNVPFVLAGPSAWGRGVFEPLTAPMIQLSEGFTALAMAGYVVVPRWGTASLFWLFYGFTLFAYARHTRALRDLCWLLPGIVLWFGYRALMSYWYLWTLPALAALLAPAQDAAASAAAPEARSWKPTARAGAALAALATALLVWSAGRPPSFGLAVNGALQTIGPFVLGMQVRVHNRTDHRVRPRFTLQSGALQPLPWSTESGPRWLDAGETATYALRARHPYNQFAVRTGARLAVSDDGKPDVRAFTEIAADLDYQRVDRIPNAQLRFTDVRTGDPFAWAFERSTREVQLSSSAGARAGERRVVISFSARTDTATGAARRFGHLHTLFALSDIELTVDVNVPPEANRSPHEEVYGLRLAVGHWRGFVLFGDEQQGALPTGERFVSLAAPRGEWATVTFSLRAVLERLGALLVERRFAYPRVPDLDIPSVPVQIGMYASTLSEGATAISFGAIHQQQVRSATSAFAMSDASEASRMTWQAGLASDLENFGDAARLLEQAVALEPTVERLRALGDAYRADEKMALAKASYSRALALPGATASPERLDALRALILVSVALGDCEEARRREATLSAAGPIVPAIDLARCTLP